MADATPFGKFVPGFDFLQNLVKGAGAALPNMGQWVAPTLDPAELEKRIDELRTVQFWLEQNAKLLGTTIQALEVQRMTLATLKTMNVQMTDLREAMTIKMPERAAEPSWPAPPPAPAAADVRPPAAAAKPASEPAAEDPADAAQPAGVVDPMQWWGALTRQFTDIAARALHESVPAGAVPGAATPSVQKGQAAGAAQPLAKPLAKSASKPEPASRPAAARKAPAKSPARGRSSRS